METIRIALTGARGFVGKALAAALGERSGRPISLLSIISGKVDNRSESLHEIGFENKELPDRLRDIQIFIHTAGKSKGTPDALRQANVSSLQRYIDILPASLEQVIHFSSVNVLFPKLSTYGETKRQGELLWASSPFAGRVTVLRPALIYGPGDRQNIGRLIHLVDRYPVIPVPASGSMRPVYVRDVADLVVSMIDQQTCAGQTMVISGVEQTNFSDLVQRLASLLDRRRVCLPLPDWLLAPFSKAASRSGLERLSQGIDGYRLDRPWHDPSVWQYLGRPTTCLDDGLRQCVDYYRETAEKNERFAD
jgi:nucleoside-diphosphate-sugar epimerase